MAAVIAARSELERLGIPHRRPDDYFAEMLKTDDHMQKVRALHKSVALPMIFFLSPQLLSQIKERLILEQKKISAVETRKKGKEAATFAKQVAAERAKEKAADRRAHEDTLKQWRKHKDSRTDLSKPEDLDALFDSANRKSTAATRGRRAAKDKRYGHGGSKRFKKDNTAGSSASDKGFSMRKNKSLPPGVRPKRPRNAGANRPGKRARISKGSKR